MSTFYTRSDVSKLVALVATYVLVAQLVTTVLGGNSVIGFMLMTSGVALAVLLLGGERFLPAMFLGAFLGFASIGEFSGLALLSSLRHVGTLFVCKWLLDRITRLDPDLGSLHDTLRIFALAIGFGLVAASVIHLTSMVAPSLVLGKDTFLQRWAAHTLIIIVTTPVLLIWRKFPADWVAPARALEVALILGVTFLVGQVVFLDWFHASLGEIARGYWLYLFITWVAVRLGLHGTVIVLAMVALQGLVGAAMGLGFFSNDLAQTNLSNYFFYNMTLAAVGLPLATYFNERKLATAALELHSNTLEATVARRTADLAARLEDMSVLNKKLEDVHIQLLQSEKMASLGQLAAGVAHEINNPIAFVHSNLGVLETHLSDIFEVLGAYEAAISHSVSPQDLDALNQLKSDKELDYVKSDIPALLAESKDGVMRVKDIVQNLKDFSRVGDASWEWADIHHGLDSTLKILANQLKYKCTVVKHYEPGLPKIRCIAGQLNQVFINLLVNAANAIETRGDITITTQSLSPGTIRISISDTGCGIPSGYQVRIFDPFFTTKPVGQGTGLGLSIVYGIVSKHYGKIEVESTVGQGSTFVLTLPVDPPA